MYVNRVKKYISHHYLLILIVLTFFSSCSQISSRRYTHNEIFHNVCFSGQGRGIIKNREDSQRFSYESLLKNDSSWTIGFIIPFKGMQLITMKKNNSSGKFVIEGKMLHHFEREWEEFHLQALGEILEAFLKHKGFVDRSWDVEYDDQEEELFLTKTNKTTGSSFEFKAIQAKKNIYFELKNKHGNILNFYLYPLSCQL